MIVGVNNIVTFDILIFLFANKEEKNSIFIFVFIISNIINQKKINHSQTKRTDNFLVERFFLEEIFFIVG